MSPMTLGLPRTSHAIVPASIQAPPASRVLLFCHFLMLTSRVRVWWVLRVLGLRDPHRWSPRMGGVGSRPQQSLGA
jgi:hypothetical protein